MHFLFILLMGWLVSFLGQLPLGTMSITATHIAILESFKNAWRYAIGVALIEILYLRLVLVGVQWVYAHKLLFTIIGWLAVVFFLLFAIISFVMVIKNKANEKNILLQNKLNRFVLGMSMSALNPAQIPFWFIWSTYLINAKILQANTLSLNVFTIGCGIGTITGLAFYMHGGNWLIKKMNAGARTLNIIMGIVFLFAAMIQLYRMLFLSML
ncbi:MAG: LysE family transporter [Hydrotalea flava]|uniref:LysE family transporter n=1 Tax=Hydrotalea lipotrueae TaxID=2803817 RepID=UPI0016938B60|nr:LysE family transporter [Hydrotalea lipotrueae]NIM34049.1 LysE family transporter [Hydrotalea flava]NIM37251.1 LysE family transporter [Hydrotalea flava]NIN02064.1 LysE family transporter [Hydrotalea flava]NIN14096.1 LysE family transporter [Hydrotalea flava]NIO93177.1 LysE family transporter [Hydrotalea flava]